MSQAVAETKPGNALATTAMSEGDLMQVLRDSVFPGAKDESIKMAVSYCRAAKLDILQKPVHIVPMNVKKPGTRDQYEWRDVVMPGINLYRTQAARTEQHAGTTEPEFGPMVKQRFGTNENGEGGFELVYPEWCKVTVKKIMPGGHIAEFTAKEYWLENYATAGNSTDRPNAMWKKRMRGQIAKCAEAQALRKAFPEFAGAPTAEEMEGKTIDLDEAGNLQAGGITPPEVLDSWLKRARAAQTDAEAVKVYTEGLQVLSKDLSAAAEFKRTVIARRRALQGGATDAEPKPASTATTVADRQPVDDQRGEESQDTPAAAQQPHADEAAAATGGRQPITLAYVVDLMLRAVRKKDPDALDIAADWISEIGDEGQRKEATTKYEAFKLEIAEGATT